MTTSHDSFTVLVGVCGGVAAYKVVDAVSRLRKNGAEIHVAMSEAAQEFITPLTFGAVSGQPVLTTLFARDSSASGEARYPHLYPATRSDFFIVMPATADMIARLAQGLGSDLISTCALSLPPQCHRVFCPAMNVEMWRQSVVQENVRALEARGWVRIGPTAGALACGMEGEGRMSEPADIVAAVLDARARSRRLAGRHILLLSGPTREHLDPVRFIGNSSTGKMGRALAEEALAAGATVDMVSGPVAKEQLPFGPNLKLHHVISAQEMLRAAQELYDRADIVIYAAAIADYQPAERSDQKLPKRNDGLVLQLQPTPDVAATLNRAKRPGQVTIGFALQTHDATAKAEEKLIRKELDGIVLNGAEALGSDSGHYTFLARQSGGSPGAELWGTLDKRACARRILDAALARLMIGVGPASTPR